MKASNCAWLWVQNLIISSKRIGWEGSAELLNKFEGSIDSLKNLAYRLYDVCEKKNWAKEGIGYNQLVTDWQTILDTMLQMNSKKSEPKQIELDF